MADLAAVFADPATYFRTVPERNNLKLISKMVTSTRIGVTCLNTGARTQYRGSKIAFPSDWARIANWYNAAKSESFCAIGTETATGIEYDYSSASDGSHGTGTLVFDAAGTLVDQTYSSFFPRAAFEMLSMLAPPAIARAQLAQYRAENNEYEYEVVAAIKDEKPALFHGLRGDRDNGWAYVVDVSRGFDTTTYIRARSRINSRGMIKYVVTVSLEGDRIASRIAFDIEGNLIGIYGEPGICPTKILALVRPRK